MSITIRHLCFRFIFLLICFSLLNLFLPTTLYAQCPAVPVEEAISNGDFEAGDTDFIPPPGYQKIPLRGVSGPRTFQVSTNETFPGSGQSTYNGAFDGVTDHTKPGGKNGIFLMIDADNIAGTVAWQTTVTIYPNQTYYFSAWVTSLLGSNFADLEFQISGGNTNNFTSLGARFAPASKGVWEQNSSTWNSAGFTTAIIRIVDFNTNGGNGNDFGLDDISFINGCQNTSGGPVPSLIKSISLCLDGDVILKSTSDISSAAPNIFWQKIGGPNLNFENGKQSITVSTPGKYQVCVNFGGCVRSSVVEVKNDIVLDMPDLTVCKEKSTLLDTKLSGSKLNFEWRKGAALVGSQSSYIIPAGGAGSYVLKVSSSHPSCVNSSKTDNILITEKDCFTVNASGSPVNPCMGDEVILSALTNGFIEKWENSLNINLGKTSKILVFPSALINTYKVTAKFPTDTISKNGDFENGFNDFSSGFIKRTDAQFQNGDYLIIKGNENYLQDALQNTTDISGNGNMLLVKGANDRNTQVIYSQTIPVTINTEYGISFYLKNLIANLANSAPIDLELRLNGVKVMEINNPLDNNWHFYSYLFRSSGSSVNVEIVGQNTFTDNKLRIMAFDNIYVGKAGIPESAIVIINANDCRTLSTKGDTTTCLGAAVKLSASTNGFITKWSPSTGISDQNSLSPSAAPSSTTTYTVEARYPEDRFFTNSAFSNGTKDFTSGLTLATAGNSPQDNQYLIVKGDENYLSFPVFKTVNDHTTGSGFYLLANSRTLNDQTVFRDTVQNITGNTYGISFFVANLDADLNNAVELQIDIKVGGVTIKSTIVSKDRTWHKIEATWVANSSGKVLVEIISPKESTDKNRVFGIDDLVLATLGNPKTANRKIEIKDCFTVTAKEIGLCSEDSIKIEAETNGIFVGWTLQGGGTSGISNPKSKLTWVKPGVSTTYIATVKLQLGNQITNGDFEDGNVGFGSDYFCCLFSGPGRYSIGNDPLISSNNAGFTFSRKDHTSKSGKMYMADGGSNPNENVYRNTVNVVKGTEYIFSAWLANIHIEFLKSNPDTSLLKTTNLAFFINSQENNAIKLPLDTAWHQFYATWKSDVSGPIIIEIRDRETAFAGNDFALDDIVFAPVYPIEKTASVTPSCIICNQPTSVEISSSTPSFTGLGGNKKILACDSNGTVATLKGVYTNGLKTNVNPYQYSWYKKGTQPIYVNNTVISDKSLTAADSGIWILRVEDYNGTVGISKCFKEDSIKLEILQLPTASITAIADKFCNDGIDEATVEVSINKASKANYSVLITGLVDGDISLNITGNSATYKTKKAQTFTIKSLKDGNNCTTKSTNLSGSAEVKAIAKPVAIITIPGISPKLISALSTPIAVQVPGVGYIGSWTLPFLGDQGIIKNKSGTSQDSLTTLLKTEEDGAGKGTTRVVWNVKDLSGECKDSTDTVTVIRRGATIPKAGRDTVFCSASLPKKFPGNGPATLIDIETFKWKELQNPPVANISGNDITLPVNVPEGTYKFEFSIQNAISGTDLKDTLIIKVDGITEIPVLKPGFTGTSSSAPYLICGSDLILPGIKTTQIAEGKNWWQKISGTGIITIFDSVSANSSSSERPDMIDISGLVQTKFYYKNGICPTKSIDFYLEKIGNISPADVAINGKSGSGSKEYFTAKDSLYQNKPLLAIADTLCSGGNYTLFPRKIKSNEKGKWIKVSGTNITLSGVSATDLDQPLTITDTGKSVFIWEVQGPIPACNPNKITITLVVNDVPKLGVIDGNSAVCEGTDTLYKINPSSKSTLPVTYSWNSGSNLGAQRTGKPTGIETKYRFYSDGTLDQSNITSTPTNACGTGNVISKIVDIRLAPRELSPSDPMDNIIGNNNFCASKISASYILNKHPDVENFNWYWGNTFVLKTKNINTDSAIILQPTRWDSLAIADKKYNLKVELTNRCSDTAIKNSIMPIVKTKIITVKAPLSVNVKLRGTTQFCIPNQSVLFDADSITTFPGLLRSYEFTLSRGGNITTLQTGPSDKYLAPVGFLQDNDKVKVRLIQEPNPRQCIVYNNPKDSVIMEGFGFPPSEIINLTPLIICETEPGIILSVKQEFTSKKNPWNKDIKWFKSGTYLPQYDGLFKLPPLKYITEGGDYTVKLESNPLGCAPFVSNTKIAAKTYIYENPEASVIYDPFVIPYLDGVNIYHMPIVVTKPVKDTLTKSVYNPNTWLENPKNPSTLLIPEKEEKEVTYTLILETGSGVCHVEKSIKVVYYLQLDIPNAFTPNGDGLNDNWVILGLGKYPDTKVNVYNRWGNAVFVDNNGYKAVWNGTHNGVPLPAGTYYYIIELKGSPDNTDQSKTGALTIIR